MVMTVEEYKNKIPTEIAKGYQLVKRQYESIDNSVVEEFIKLWDKYGYELYELNPSMVYMVMSQYKLNYYNNLGTRLKMKLEVVLSIIESLIKR